MLNFLRGRKRFSSAVLIIFIFALVITLVAFFTATRPGGAMANADNSMTIAKVGGLPVTLGEFKQRARPFLGQSDPRFESPESFMMLQMRGTHKIIRDVLIREKIVELEAERLGLTATDEELTERLRQQWSDASGKFIGEQDYKRSLAQQGISWQDYERQVRSSITREKLNNYLTSGVAVTPQEVENEYKRTETAVNVVYGVVKPADVRETLTLSEEELRNYFNAHKDKFKITTDQKKVDYLFVNTTEISKTMTVDDAELRKRYDTTDQVDQVQISQIVLNVLASADDETVRQKAAELVQRARGAGVAQEDFAALARGNSQDPVTAAKGGDLGLIKRDRNRPNDVYQRAFSMNTGDISEPIKQGNKYYIIKVGEKKKRTFEEARESLLVSARNDLSYKKAVKIADEARALLVQNKNLAQTAEEINRRYGAGVATVKSTPYFAPGDNVPEIGANQNFEEGVKDLKNKGDVGQKVGVPNGFAVPVLADTRGPHDAVFEEVRDKVEREAKNEKAKDAAGQKAGQIAQAAGSADGLKAALEAAKLRADTKDDFKAGQSLLGVGESAQVEAAILALQAGQVTQQPIKVGNDYVVVGVTKRTEADLSKFPDQKKAIADRLLQERKNAIFTAYLEAKYRELEQSGDLEIYDDALAQAFGAGGSE